MAYALVGSVGTVATGAGSATPAFAQSTTAGNLLVAWVVNNGGNSINAALPSGWSTASFFSIIGAYVCYKANCAAGESNPTFTNGDVQFVAAAVAEFSGAATTSPVDKVGSVGSGASPRVAVNSAADAATGELFLSTGYWLLSKAGTHTTADTYNNATPTGNLQNDATSTATHYRFAYGITTSNAAADQDSQTSNSMNVTGGFLSVASFKLAAAGPTTYQKTGVAVMN